MFDEGRYSAEELQRNRFTVSSIAAAGVLACILGGAFTKWPWANALGTAVVVLVFGAALWWAFCSRKAGPLSVNAGAWNRFRRTWFMKTD